MIVIPGPQITLRIVSSSEQWSFCISARFGSHRPATTAEGSATARATTSRTDLWVESALTAARQSAINWSTSNIACLPFLSLSGSQHRGLGAMPLVVEIIGSIKLEDQITINRGRIPRRIVTAGACRDGLDHAVRVRAVEIGDRIAVGPGFVEDAMRCRQKPVVGPTPHDVAEIDEKRPWNNRRREPLA